MIVEKGFKVVEDMHSIVFGSVQIAYAVGEWVFPPDKRVNITTGKHGVNSVETVTCGALAVFGSLQDANRWAMDKWGDVKIFKCLYVPSFMRVMYNGTSCIILRDDNKGIRITSSYTGCDLKMSRVNIPKGCRLASAVKLVEEVPA